MKRGEIIVAAAIGIILVAVRYWPFIFGQTLFYGDNYSLLVPGKIFTAQWVKTGVIPLWNPLILSGISWIGDISQSIFYPTTLLFMIFDPANALNLSILSSLAFTFLGMYLLARQLRIHRTGSLLSSILWTFSTVVTGSVNNLATLQSIAWFPWVLWGSVSIGKTWQKNVVLSLIITGHILAGYPQHVILAVSLAIVFTLVFRQKTFGFGKWFLAWAQTLLLSACLSAFVLLPFLVTFLQSTRVDQSIAQAGSGSLVLPMTIKLILPYFFDHPAAGIRWGAAWSGEQNTFMYFTWTGLAVLGIVLFNFRKWDKIDTFFIAAGTLAFFYSLGSNLPGYDWLQSIVPLLRSGRSPSLVLIATTISIAILIGRHFSRTVTTLAHSRWILFGLVSALFFLTIYILTLAIPTHLWDLLNNISNNKLSLSEFHTIERDTIIMQMIFRNAFINGMLLFLALLALRKNRNLFAIAIIFLDLCFNTQGLLMYAKNEIYSQNRLYSSEISKQLKNLNTSSFRFLTRNFNSPYTDFIMYSEAQITRAPFSDSFIDQEELDERKVLTRLRNGATPDWNMVSGIPLVHGYTTLLPRDYSQLMSQNTETRINYLPTLPADAAILDEWAVKYYLVDSWFEIKEDLSGLPKISEVDNFTLYERPQALPRLRWLTGSGNLTLEGENPNQVTIAVEADSTDTILFADRHESGWVAQTIEGNPLEVSNYRGFRAIAVPQGKHTITMRYQPNPFILGTIISFITVASLLLALQYNHARKNRHHFS